MNWIKVTPETMPPLCVPVIATIYQTNDNKHFFSYTDIVSYQGRLGWVFEIGDKEKAYLMQNKKYEVTHWMPLPEPAQDDE